MSGVNWPAVGVAVTAIGLLILGVWVLARTVFSANRDTAVPVTAESIRSMIADELADDRLRERVDRLEEQLRTTQIDLHAAQRELAEALADNRRMRITITEQHDEIGRLRGTVTALQTRVNSGRPEPA